MNPNTRTGEASVKKSFGWKFWTVAFCLVGPHLILPWLKPEWLGRLVGVTTVFLSVNMLLVIYGCHPKSEFIYSKSKIARKGSDRTKRNVGILLRGLVIASGIWWIFVMTIPMIKDCIGVASHGRSYLIEVKGQVEDNKIMFGLSFIQQNILISTEDKFQMQRSHAALYFPRVARRGQSYQFLIAPNSRVVLDWQLSKNNDVD